MAKRSVPEPEETAPEASGTDDAGETDKAGETDAEQPTFANRAERRAHGKGKAVPPPSQKGHFPHGRGSVQGPRQWGNRRSG